MLCLRVCVRERTYQLNGGNLGEMFDKLETIEWRTQF